MILREMVTDDLEQVMEIETSVFSTPWTKEGFFSFLMRSDTMFLVIEEKGKILGYAGVMKILDEGEVTNVAVCPKRQGEGIGSFLLDGMARILKDLGIHVLHLEVRESNTTARRLYERLGFANDGKRRGYYVEPAEDAVLMSLQLH